LFVMTLSYAWTTVPLAGALLLLLFLAPPRFERGLTLWFDVALVACLVAIALQLIPLSPTQRLSIAPSAVAYDQSIRVAEAAEVRSAPISTAPRATAWALYLDALILLVFWTARQTFRTGGIRLVLRAIAWMGLAAAVLGIAQHITAPNDFYWVIRPLGPTAPTYTPFANRNDFAGWLLMAIPLTQGYIITRIASRRHAGGPFDPDAALDTRNLLLGFAVFVMTAALLASLSRSAMAGAAASFALFTIIARRRMSAKRFAMMIVSAVAMIALAFMYVSAGTLASRLGSALDEGVTVRLSVWQQTWPMVRDFWPVGSGVGSYQRVMLLYQTMSRYFYISHADNEYLQILAEGGALVGIPVAVAIVSGAIAIGRRLARDRTPLFWVRVGAACGIIGVAVQSVWEMTLRMPPNAVLLAILFAIALHE
jgi:O-antigen ligase/polysaccharide polymerase Wzy-like membrane protein